MSKPKPGQAKLIVIVVALIAFSIAGFFIYQQWVAAAEYNRLLQLVNEGDYKTATEGLEKLITQAPSNIAEKAKLQAADAYRLLGDDPGLSIVQSAAYYSRAAELQPGSLNAEQQAQVDLAARLKNQR